MAILEASGLLKFPHCSALASAMNESAELIFARLMELRDSMINATLSRDERLYKALNKEYESLTDSFGEAVFGGKKRDPDEIIVQLLKNAAFNELQMDPLECTEFSISDSLYAGEGFFPKKRRLTVTKVRYSQPRPDRIQFVELRTDHLWNAKGLKYLGHRSADTGCVLVLNRRRKTAEEKQNLENWLTSTYGGELIRSVVAHEFVGVVIESWYGSGGFCVYAREQSLILDFSGARKDSRTFIRRKLRAGIIARPGKVFPCGGTSLRYPVVSRERQ